MQITTKRQFYELMRAGCLGNTLRNWTTAEEAYESGVGIFGIRQIGSSGGGRHQICHRASIIQESRLWDLDNRRYIIDEAAPDKDVILQGEIIQTYRGLEGFLGIRTGCRMRESIARGLFRSIIGLRVKLLLEEFVDPSSRDDINDLFQIYPGAAIEFASYPYNLGNLRGRNTIIWEVRNY